MNLRRYLILILVSISLTIPSCSDADIVAGVYTGRIYRTDTMNATATVVRVNDSFIKIEVKAEGETGGYVEYAQLTKTAEEAYNLWLSDPLGSMQLSGYYYENALHINAFTSNFAFDGVSP